MRYEKMSELTDEEWCKCDPRIADSVCQGREGKGVNSVRVHAGGEWKWIRSQIFSRIWSFSLKVPKSQLNFLDNNAGFCV